MSTEYERTRMVFRYGLAAVALAGVSLTAQAGTITSSTAGWAAQMVANTIAFTDVTSAPNWATSPGAGAMASKGPIGFASNGQTLWTQGETKIPLPGNRELPVKLTQPIARSAAIGALGRFAMRAAGPLAVGMTLYNLLEELDGFSSDPVTGAPVKAVDKNGAAPDGWWCWHPSFPTPYANGVTYFEWGGPENMRYGGACGVMITEPNNYAVGTWETSLPAGTELPAGTPATQAEVEQAIGKKVDMGGWTMAQMHALVDALNAGMTVDISGMPTVSGPASVAGPTTTATETTPTGNKTRTTTTTYKPSYSGNTATVNEETTTVTTNPDGTTTTETTTTEKPVDGPKCSEGSTSVECSQFDTPEGPAMPKETKTISFAADDLGLGNGQCPAPVTWRDSLGSHSIELAPLCDKITGVVRPLVILAATIMAIFIVMPGIKSE